MTGRDHGGGIDAARAVFGGARQDWLDLSTGINPVAYPFHAPSPECWTGLPDTGAQSALLDAARRFWSVPDGADIVAAPGASLLIAQIPGLVTAAAVNIPQPTYNEHAAAFAAWGWSQADNAPARVLVNPNNPDGRFWTASDLGTGLTVVDESFCDETPERSLIGQATHHGKIVLKSFGKFWGLAGLRLGFAICLPDLAQCLRDRIGPWAISGPALHIATQALSDRNWTDKTRERLKTDVTRMDGLLNGAGLTVLGGTGLFRLARADNAQAVYDRLARAHVLVRIFPYSAQLVRFGLPGTEPDWDRLEAALP